ncbi:IPT/TIG domain-containing protein [Streptomyces gamaensis]|uniref:IPT/TIG domain-containing protein n=1 Tax=Streptomyces gamaensis TaxID=1763542 RepID=A0ABW0YRX6_9ACTN
MRWAASFLTAACAALALTSGPAAVAADGPAPGSSGPDVAVDLSGLHPMKPGDNGNFSVSWTSVGTEDVTGVTRLTLDLPPGITTHGALMYSTPYDYVFSETVSPDGRHLDATFTGSIAPGRRHFMKVQFAAGPQLPTGTVTATVANSADTDPGNNVAMYDFGDPSRQATPQPEPVVTSLDTTTGPGAGGTAVTVRGRELGHGFVLFGDEPARGSCADTVCTVTAPGGSGTVPVDVVTPGGAVQAGTYAYTGAPLPPPPAPAVTHLSVRSGPERGGTTVHVFGTDLGTGTVRFGDRLAPHGSCGPQFCSATSPAGTGTVDVTVETAGGTSERTAADRFTYTP